MIGIYLISFKFLGCFQQKINVKGKINKKRQREIQGIELDYYSDLYINQKIQKRKKENRLINQYNNNEINI